MTTKTKTTSVAALVPIDHDGTIYRRGQVLDVDPQLAASLTDRGIAQRPGARVESPQRASAAFATATVEPTFGALPLAPGLVEIEVVRPAAYAELDGGYCQAGTRWLVHPSVARQLERTGDARTIGEIA